MTYAADFEKSLQVGRPRTSRRFSALAGADRQRKVVDRDEGPGEGHRHAANAATSS